MEDDSQVNDIKLQNYRSQEGKGHDSTIFIVSNHSGSKLGEDSPQIFYVDESKIIKKSQSREKIKRKAAKNTPNKQVVTAKTFVKKPL